MMLLLAARRGKNAIAWLPGRLHAERFSWANADGLKGFYDDLVPKTVKKLAKSWNTQIIKIQIPTTTRSFVVKKIKGSESYEIIEKSTGRKIDHTFDNLADAHACKNMLEQPAQENLLGLLISDEMRTDLIKKGLPCLGAIGSRVILKNTSLMNSPEVQRNSFVSESKKSSP
jgi:Ni2+-binding GTPase involved in maturation of urease and hydrogenase